MLDGKSSRPAGLRGLPGGHRSLTGGHFFGPYPATDPAAPLSPLHGRWVLALFLGRRLPVLDLAAGDVDHELGELSGVAGRQKSPLPEFPALAFIVKNR
jgi:hypothetical protein